MKYTITHIAEWILIAIIMVLFAFTIWKTYQIKEKVEYITTTDTITVTDSITNWVPYNVYHYRTDTAYLPIIKEKLDTILKIDSVSVQVPLDVYKFDSIIKDSLHTTHVEATVSGFNVEMQQLSIETKITPQEPKKEPWYKNIGVGVGLMYGTGGAGVGVGLMYKL